MRNLVIASLLVCGINVAAQSEISTYRPGLTSEGAVYFLPKTALRIVVQTEKTTYVPGDFCKYAERYLRLNDVGQETMTSYRITNISISAFGVADTTKSFAVKYNAKSVAANVSLSDDGRLLAINADAKEEAMPAAFVPSPKAVSEDPRKYMGQDILASGSTAKMAEMTAQEIYDIRDSKNQLNRGEADFMPKDGEQLRLMLANLDKQDLMLTQMFTGTTVRDTVEQTFTLCPEGEMRRQILFRLSQKLGLVDKDDLAGAPYYINIEDLHSLPTTPPEELAKAKKKKISDKGIYVNIPGRIRVTISKGNKTVANAELQAGQFGNTELLSGELFNKRSTTHLTLNPTTGAVDRLDAEMPK